MSTIAESTTIQMAQVDPQTIETSELAESKEVLNSRLRDLVNTAPVMLFMKGVTKCPLCRFSRRIVRILNEHGIQYDSFNVLQDEAFGDKAIRQGIKEYADWPTFPQLWLNGELVGGLDVLKEQFAANPEFLSAYKVPEIADDVLQEIV
ncbi:glutaredoxin [Fusarium napiforme]|uniref:Glutaredoxin n=1 Tax=Fusarium napiforme TaxID=42672 RepID=A0A8H5I9L3_9HYPO|nr:glutaredoxin [Fusarium napiforme]